MKKFLFILSLVLVAFTLTAQDRSLPSSTTYYSFDRDPLDQYYSYMSYTGTSSDYLLPTIRDTIDFRYDTKASSPYDMDVILTYNKVAGTDTTVTVLILGRNSENESWTTISTNVSSVISGQIVQSISNGKTATVASHTVTIPQYTSTDASHTLVGTAFTMKQDTAGFMNYPADSIKVPAITFTEAAQTITHAAQTVTEAAQTITYTDKLRYRLICVRCILTGDDSVGTGIKIIKVENKLWK